MEKKESLNKTTKSVVIKVQLMRQKDRTAMFIIGLISIVGGLSSIAGSILTHSSVGYVLAIPLNVVGMILIFIAVKAE